MNRLADFLIKYPKSVLLSIVVLMFAAIYPASRIQADFSLEGFFPKNAPTIIDYQRFLNDYGRDDNIIAILLQSDDVLSEQVLQAIQVTSDSIQNIYGIEKTASLLTAESLVSEDGQLITRKWIEQRPINIDKRDSLLTSWSEDPFLADLMVNRNGTVTGLYVELSADMTTYTHRQRIIDEIEPHLRHLYKVADVQITGIPYFRNMYVNRLNQQIIFYISVSSVLIIFLLWFLYRNWRDVFLPIGIVWLTILMTVAVLQLTGGYFEIMSSTIAPILLCVGIADSIHMMSKYNDELIHGSSPNQSIKNALTTMGTATFLTSVTTAIGFATLSTSNVLPMRNFGLYTAVGVMIAFLVTIFALPSLLKVTGESPKLKPGKEWLHRLMGRFLEKLDVWVYSYRKRVVVGTLFLTGLIGYGITDLRVNSYIFDDVGKDSDLLQAAEFASENLTPQFPLEIIISTGNENGINDPNLLVRVDSLHRFLETFPEFRKVNSFASLMRETQSLLDPDIALKNPLPDSPEKIAQYQLLLELTGSEAVTSYTDFDYSEMRVSVLTEDMGSYRMNGLRDTLDAFIEATFPNESVMMTGSNILVADLTHNIVNSLTWSILLAIVLIGMIMWALFRKPSLIFISMLPNVIPLLITAGIMGYLQIWIKPSTAVIFTIAFGIAVDDTIHYLARMRLESKRAGALFRPTIQLTTEKTGRAIILTSIILVAGFGTLGFSDFDSTRLMGLLVCLTIFNALIADLIFLPALVYWIKPDLGWAKSNELISAKEPENDPKPILE
jgi:predicted RND superfamily exporter protein